MPHGRFTPLLTSLLHDAAKQSIDVMTDDAIPSSPNVSEDTLGILASTASNYREWGKVSDGYDSLVGTDPALTSFFQTGNLAEGVRSDRFVLSIRRFMAELMWKELAIRGLVTFYYHHDSANGSHFGPNGFGICGTAAEFCLSPGFFVDWVERRDTVDLDAVIEAIQDEQWEPLAPEFKAIGAIAIGVRRGDLSPVLESVYQSLLGECKVMSQFDEQCIVTHVTVNALSLRSHLEKSGTSYAELPEDAKSLLASRLIDTLSHPFLGGFRVSHHLLATMLLHPETPAAVRKRIKECGPLEGESKSDGRPYACIRMSTRDLPLDEHEQMVRLIDEGKYAEAAPLAIQAVNDSLHKHGEEAADTAANLSNLALLYAMQGKPDEAETLYRRALAISEKVLGPEHPDTATDLNNLASHYYEQGKYDEAEPLYKRALAIRENVLGPEHPETVTTREQLDAMRQKRRDPAAE